MRPFVCSAGLMVFLTASHGSFAGDPKLPLLFADDFEKDADRWQPTDAKAWKLVQTKEGRHYSQDSGNWDDVKVHGIRHTK